MVLSQSASAWNPIYMYRSDGYLIAVGDTIGLGKDGNIQKFRVDWTDFEEEGGSLGFYFKLADDNYDSSGNNNKYIALGNATSTWTNYTISSDVSSSSPWDITACIGANAVGTTYNSGSYWTLKDYASSTNESQYYEMLMTFTYSNGTLTSLTLDCTCSAKLTNYSCSLGYYGRSSAKTTYYLIAWPYGNSSDLDNAGIFPFTVDRMRNSDDYYYGERYTVHVQNFVLKQLGYTVSGKYASKKVCEYVGQDSTHTYARFSVMAFGHYGSFLSSFTAEFLTWQDGHYISCIDDLTTPYDIDADSTGIWKLVKTGELNSDGESYGKYVMSDSTRICTNHTLGRVKGTDYGYYGSSATSPDSIYYVKFGNAMYSSDYGSVDNRYANSLWIDLDDCGQSMTFTLIPDTAAHMFVEFNESTMGDDDWTNGYDPEGYYVIGNFTSATNDVSIDPYSSDDNRKKMTKWYYKNGISRASTDELSTLFGQTIVEATKITDYETDSNGNRLASGYKLYNWGDTLTSGEIVVDSVLFRAQVTKPDLGWGNLYVDFVGATDYETITSSWVNNEDAWKLAIRPECSWQVAIDEGVYGSDCIALQGGLFKNGNVAYQSINPVVNDTVQTAIFSINITTSTYHISYLSDTMIYITGPAVDAADLYTKDNDIKQNPNWATESGGSEYSYGIPLTKAEDTDYYAFYGADGTSEEEVAITMTAGKLFTFNTNLDFTYTTYQEDAVTPVDLKGDSDKTTERYAYTATANGRNYDTQYVNYLAEGQGLTASDYYDASVNASTWGLPTGDYYIRLYLGVKDGDQTVNFYTVKRSYDFNCPDAIGFEEEDPNAFKVFCDYNAVVIPDDVRVYYVPESPTIKEDTSADTDSALWYYKPYTISLKEYEFTDNDDRVLPGNTPVILGIYVDRDKYFDDDGTYSNGDDNSVTLADGRSTLLRKTITMEYYGEPNITWGSISSQEQIASALTPCIEYGAIPAYQTLTYTDGEVQSATRNVTADDGTTTTETYYYLERTYSVSQHTFIFGYKKLNSNDTKPTIGFFYGAGNSAINGAYLTVSGDDLPYTWTSRLECDADGNVSTSSDGTETSGKPALLFYETTSDGTDIDPDSDDDATGITYVCGTTTSDDAPFYTLQGIRLAGEPTQRGIYIRNGRKVIVK